MSRETVAESSLGADAPLGVATHQLEPGQTVGRFEIIDKLGEGGMGLVYRARDPHLEREVALKVLRAPTRAHREPERAQNRLLREAQAMARVTHANVLPVHEVSSVDGVVFLVMELVRGGTLEKWLTERRPVDAVLRAFVDAGNGLAAAHAEGLVHRDFKPANVLVGTDGRVRVTDFGLVSAGTGDISDGDEPAQAPAALRDSMTRTGQALGTPAYMSPEQHAGQTADARSDQFSFCVSLYEALYGERPFRGAERSGLRPAQSTTAEEPRFRGARVPPRVVRALRRGLSADASHRFGDMPALIAELEAELGRGRPTLTWVAAAIVLAALGAMVYLLSRPQADAALGPESGQSVTQESSAAPPQAEPTSTQAPSPPPTATATELIPQTAPSARSAPPPKPRSPAKQMPAPPPSSAKPAPGARPSTEDTQDRSERARRRLLLEE